MNKAILLLLYIDVAMEGFVYLEPMRVYAGPARYVQGRGALLRLGMEIKGVGLNGRAFILVSKTAEKATRHLWEASLNESGIPCNVGVGVWGVMERPMHLRNFSNKNEIY